MTSICLVGGCWSVRLHTSDRYVVLSSYSREELAARIDMDPIRLRHRNRAVMVNRAMPLPPSNANESDNEGRGCESCRRHAGPNMSIDQTRWKACAGDALR